METEKKKQKGGRKMGTKNIVTFYGETPYSTLKTTEDNRLERKTLIKIIEEFLLDVGVSRSDFFCEDTQHMYIVLFLKSYLDTWTEFPEQNHSTLPTKSEFLSLYPQFEGYSTPEYNKKREEEYEIEKTLAGVVKEEIIIKKIKKTDVKFEIMSRFILTQEVISLEEVKETLKEEGYDLNLEQTCNLFWNVVEKLRKGGWEGKKPKYVRQQNSIPNNN